MQFQHGTQLPALGAGAIGAQVLTSPPAIANGSGVNILGSASSTYATTLQAILVSWTGVTAAGQINFQYGTTVGQTVVIYQTTGIGTLYIPCNGIVLTNYGLHIANSSTGGTYTITAFYTIIST